MGQTHTQFCRQDQRARTRRLCDSTRLTVAVHQILFQAKTKKPNSAAASSSHAELRRKRISRVRLTASMAIVVKSTSAARPSRQVTTAINDREAALIPSRTAPAVADLRIRGTSGPLTATKKKAGRNIPTVATTAPGAPPRM